MDKNTLRNFKDEDLKAELELRKKKREELEKMERGERIRLVIENRDTLIKFMTHDRSTCKDGEYSNCGFHPEHGGANCNLCCLEDLDGWEDDVDVIVDIRFIQIKDR